MDRLPTPEELRAAADQARTIATGWALFRGAAFPPGITDEQTEGVRMAFYAGAQYLFAACMVLVDDEADPSVDDVRRMSKIAEELRAYARSQR